MGFGAVAAERAAIEMTYEDQADVYRTENQTVGSITHKAEKRVYDSLPCALSYTGPGDGKQTAAQNQVEYDAVVFLAPELEIRPGDHIQLVRLGRIPLTFSVAGRPAVYATHQEVKVREEALA